MHVFLLEPMNMFSPPLSPLSLSHSFSRLGLSS